MNWFIPRTAICLLAFHFALSAKAQNTLEHAEDLFNQYNLAESHASYRRIAASAEAGAAIRVTAYQKLAAQDWKFYGHYDSALLSLKDAAILHTDLFGTYLLQASINLDAKLFNESKVNAARSLQLATTDHEKVSASILYAKIICAQNVDLQIRRRPLLHGDLSKGLLVLDSILEKQPGNPDASEALIGIGILLKDGMAAIKGWKSYYLISDENDINAAIKPGFNLLKPVLAKWSKTEIPAGDMKTLAIGLAASKFFNYAAMIAKQLREKDPTLFLQSSELKDIVAYQVYIDEVNGVDEWMYPQVARGLKKYEDQYDSLMNKAGSKLWNAISFTHKRRPFDPDSLYETLHDHFGLDGYTGTTVNYYGALMGHIIHKELKRIDQYGYSTSFTFISVDRLISSDFTSWYGTTNVGGWGDSATITQVRKAYMSEPFQALTWMTDSSENNRMVSLIAQKKLADFDVCKKDPYAEPKFLSLYLKFNEAKKIYKHLTDAGLRNMDLKIAFIDEILKLTIASTVFAHEGRHAIDQLYFPAAFKTMSDDERELRAKFSEVIYSLNPKMAFTGSIFGSSLDENTNHGKANKRFRVIIVDWMAAHSVEIEGLDKDIPLLMQFDLLTDQQLIAICKSADPFAKG